MEDDDLGMDQPITRRDFLNGVAVGIGGLLSGTLIPKIGWALDEVGGFPQDDPGYYPPALTGMRGSHPGSFEKAHDLRDDEFWQKAGKPIETRETYDLIVVGGGISGLSAAYFYRRAVGHKARILILDNHDDFGGHAKRNEFRPRGRFLLSYGGTESIESPFPYSKDARRLMEELKIDPPALEARCADHKVYQGLGRACFFDRETFGEDRLAIGMPAEDEDEGARDQPKAWRQFLAKTPLSKKAKRDIHRIQTAAVDYLKGSSQEQKKDALAHMSYADFLLKVVKAHPDVIPFFQTKTHSLYGVGIDAVSALDCWALRFPGFSGLKLDRVPSKGLSFTASGEVSAKDEYYFHYPDGNASIARMLVRTLVPGSISGNTAEDVVSAKTEYGRLDRKDSRIRIRLGSTAVRVRHCGDPSRAKEVEVVYGRGDRIYRSTAKSVVMASWNMVIPYVCPELPDDQKEALRYGVKVPLVYTVVAIKNWSAFKKLGVSRIDCPGMYHCKIELDRAVDIGGYASPKSPDEPVLVRMLRTPCSPGLPARDQQRAGHQNLYGTTFETFELKIRDQLARVLGPGGFNPKRDIEAITVNRWPHGYAYEYAPLWDPDWPSGQRPCDIARRRFGRIAIANSDAAAAAYTDQAIDQAYRAVSELLS